MEDLEIHPQHMRGLGEWLGRFPPDWPVTIDLSGPPDWWVRFPIMAEGWVEQACLPVNALGVPEMSVVVVEKQKFLQMLQLGSWRTLGSDRMSAHYSDQEPVDGCPDTAVLQEIFPANHLAPVVGLLSGSLQVPEEVVSYYGDHLGALTVWRHEDNMDSCVWVSGEVPGFQNFHLEVAVGGTCFLIGDTGYTAMSFRDPPRFGDGKPAVDGSDPRKVIELVRGLFGGDLPIDVVLRALDDPQHQSKAVRDARLSPEIVRHMAHSPSHWVRQDVARRERLPEETLDALSRDPDYRVRKAVARRSELPAEIAGRLAQDPIPEVRDAV